MMARRLAFVSLCYLLAMPAVSAPAIQKVTQIKPLLIDAIDAPGGKSKAWLEGEMADKLRVGIKAPPKTPVLATVSTIHEFRPGCKRLRLVLTTPKHLMKTVKGTLEPFSMFYELNLCRDGQPPQVSSVGME